MFFSLISIEFWAYAAYFLLILFVAFFIPGDVFLKRLKLGFFNRVTLALFIGMGLWVWQGFLFGFFSFRFLSYLYLLVFIALWIFQNKKELKRIHIKSLKLDKAFILLITAGVFIQNSAVWFTGTKIAKGVYFCCGNISDGVYHIALTRQLVENVPPFEPGIYGVIVKNYHYLSNLINADLIRVFHLPLVPTQFQYMTVFISIMLGLGAISFAKTNKLSKSFACWLLFFLYFGGDFIYLFLLLLGKGISFSMGSLEDGSIFLVNPPRAYAIVMLFGILSMFSIWIKKRDTVLSILIGLLLATLVGLKVYVGLFALAGFSIVALFYLLKRDFSIIPIILIGILGSAIFYIPVNGGAGGIYFTSFWLFENFISQPKFDLIHLELEKNVYKAHNNYPRIIQYELMYMAAYIFCIFGSKIVGFIQTRRSLSLIQLPIHVILLTGLLVSVVLGFFFQQTSGGSNSFNFIVSIFIMGSIYCALSVSYWFKRLPRAISVILAIILIALTVPRVFSQVYSNVIFVVTERGFTLPEVQLQLLQEVNTLDTGSSSVLIERNFIDMEDMTPFVSMIVDKPMFLSGRGILESHNIPTKNREKIQLDIMRNYNPLIVAKHIKKNNIGIILMSSEADISATQTAVFLDTIIKTKKSKVLRVSNEKLDSFIDTMNKAQYGQNSDE